VLRLQHSGGSLPNCLLEPSTCTLYLLPLISTQTGNAKTKALPPFLIRHLSMIILNVEDLESKGIPYRAATQFTFEGKVFSKGQSFPKKTRQAAIEICKVHLASGLACILVESLEMVTICLYKRDATEPNSDEHTSQKITPTPELHYRGASVHPAQTEAQPPVPPPSAPLTYRGAKVQSTPPPPEPPPSNPKFQLSYRGVKAKKPQ
jgi:Domain of unknown function (DUF4278)